MKKSGLNKTTYDRRVVREDLSHLDSTVKERIKFVIEAKLTTYPEIYGKPLHSRLRRYWKLRVGHWRIIYEILNKEVIVHIIGHRSDVYKKIEKRIG